MPEHQPLDRRALQGGGEQKVLEGVYCGVRMSTICPSAGLGLFLNLSAVDHHHSAFTSEGFPTIHLLFGLQFVSESIVLLWPLMPRLLSRHIQSGYQRTDRGSGWFASEQEFY